MQFLINICPLVGQVKCIMWFSKVK
uniref:Uncharacterized protein n=1 Tax=Anguilla anguilla TaxID=7936 RepID=A0A0E9T557_ANGAN